jgi:GNAT superfamily N-acetyltransferase
MHYILRPASLTDLPTLLTFEQGIIQTERSFDPTLKEGTLHYYDIGELIESKTAEVLIVEFNSELAGSGYAKILPAKGYLTHEQYSYLGFMFVSENHRGKGVNKMILDGLINWSHAIGVKEIRLDVYHENKIAIEAYSKAGFKKHMTEMRLVR